MLWKVKPRPRVRKTSSGPDAAPNAKAAEVSNAVASGQPAAESQPVVPSIVIDLNSMQS